MKPPNDWTEVTLPDAEIDHRSRPGPIARFAPVQKSVGKLPLVQDSWGRSDSSPTSENVDTTKYDNGKEPVRGLQTSEVFEGGFEDFVAAAEAFADKVNDAKVGYRLLERNSNSVLGTAYEQITGEARPDLGNGDFPGYNYDLCEKDVPC